MNKVLISETAEMVLRNKNTGNTIASATMQLAGINQAITEDEIRGGIGNNLVSTIRSSKAITVTARDSLFTPEYLALTQGVEIEENGTATVTKVDSVDAGSDGAVTLNPAPVGPINYVNDLGESVTVEAGVGGAVTLTGATGQTEVHYPIEVTGNVIRFMTDKFSEAWEVELHTIAYDPDTNQVVSDIYFHFHKAIPAGDFDMNLEVGSAYAPELSLKIASEKGNKELGRMVIVDR